MADDELAIAGSALEAPASGAEQEQVETPETEVETDEVETEEGAGQDDDTIEEETDELDFAFKRYQVPKSLKEAVENLRADATRKQQDAAAKAKALETREAEIEERLKVTDTELDDRATLKAIDKQLAEFAKLTPEDWAVHMRNNPEETQLA